MMILNIAPNLRYAGRQDWGARTDIPRLGNPVARALRTEVWIHHTVAIDSDATPNLWESEAEAFGKMRQLQTIRPDLGLDVPYSFVAFMMADGSLLVCEGRGIALDGAHTKGHNKAGIAVAFGGNFEIATDVRPWLSPLSRFLGWLKNDAGLTNLGSLHPPDRAVFGHRDEKVYSNTACPGRYLYTALGQVKIGEDEMTPEQLARLERLEKAVALLVGEDLTDDVLEDALQKRDTYLANAGTVIGKAMRLIQAGSSRIAVLDSITAEANRVKADINAGEY